MEAFLFFVCVTTPQNAAVKVGDTGPAVGVEGFGVITNLIETFLRTA
jgi:hypothetical protein